MFERFRWGLTSGERYSTGRFTPQKRGIHCACQHFVSERVGVLAEYGGVVIRLPLGLRSLTLLRRLSRHSSLALFVLDIAGDGAKSVPDGQKPSQSCCKEDAQKSPRGLACEGAVRSCKDGASRGLAFGARHLRKTRLRLIGPPLQHALNLIPTALQHACDMPATHVDSRCHAKAIKMCTHSESWIPHSATVSKASYTQPSFQTMFLIEHGFRLLPSHCIAVFLAFMIFTGG